MHSDSDDTETEFLLALNGQTSSDRRKRLVWWVCFSNIEARSRAISLFGDAFACKLINMTKNLSSCSRPFRKNFSVDIILQKIVFDFAVDLLSYLFLIFQFAPFFPKLLFPRKAIVRDKSYQGQSESIHRSIKGKRVFHPVWNSDNRLYWAWYHLRLIKTSSINHRLTSSRNLIVQFKDISRCSQRI